MRKPLPKPSGVSRLLEMLPLERRFGYRLNMIGTALAQHTLLRIGREFGLNLAEYRIMNTLAAFESPSVKDIARNSQLDKAHVTRALAGLIGRGLVTQIVDPKDRRLRVVQLTADGWQIAAAFGPFQIERQRRLERSLTAGELRTFWNALAVLTEQAEKMLAEEMQLGKRRRRRTSAIEPARSNRPRKNVQKD